jgi:hypothetical protein
VLDLEPGSAHGNTKRLGLIAPGNGTAIVISE